MTAFVGIAKKIKTKIDSCDSSEGAGVGEQSGKHRQLGAQDTLDKKWGNATDTASLLIALLRASNIPAR